MIIEEYECKLEEYKQAYDRNQEIIEQLTLQLQMVPHQENSQDIYPSSDEIMMGESEGELALECKNLENNFLMALDEKDQLIESLELQNAEIKNELVNKDQLLDELSLNNEEQASKLEEVGSILERYTQKIKEM
jgi:DNA repair exonuclease SbcCD ATPase subunit